MLLLFIQNPFLASQVRELSHQCHLHLPDVWEDLPYMCFASPYLSRDPRTLRLVRRAVSNLTGVHTLRLIFGHLNLVEALLFGFFGSESAQQHRIRRLWIESCSFEKMSWFCYSSVIKGLESFRCRRLSLMPETPSEYHFGRYAVTRLHFDPHDRVWNASRPQTGTYDGTYDSAVATYILDETFDPGNKICDIIALDDRIYRKFPDASCPESVDRIASFAWELSKPDLAKTPCEIVMSLLQQTAATLTSLNLDWLSGERALIEGLAASDLSFPNLKALQIRNAAETFKRMCSYEEYHLLGTAWLHFLKRHPKIQCLAWPIEGFLPLLEQLGSPKGVRSMAISSFGRTLTELRVDTTFDLDTENQITNRDDIWACRSREARTAFIKAVAPKMTNLRVFKVEGSLPLDERIELANALHQCPLQKFVVIAVSWPVYDSWADLQPEDRRLLQHDAWDYKTRIPWKESTQAVSILETLSLTQASTITELKFCGFVGAPALHYPSAETNRQLSFLGKFHNLNYLTTAVWISTFDKNTNRKRFREIGASWYARHRGVPTSLSMMIGRKLCNESWKVFDLNHEPSLLAKRVVDLFGPHLSAQALGGRDGVTVKALFLLQKHSKNDLYEMEVRIGKKGELLSFLGPRGEEDPVRVKEKMDGRAWF